MNPKQLIECIKEQLKDYEPVSDEEHETQYMNAGECGNASDSYEMGVRLGMRLAYDEIRDFLNNHEDK